MKIQQQQQQQQHQHHRNPIIGPSDVVSVQGRYLVKKTTADGSSSSRFLIQGIAFPIPLPPPKPDENYDLQGWIDVLDQLSTETPELNTIRVYDLDCLTTPSEFMDAFLNRAAELGIYVIVPLTAIKGPGVLDRDLKAPKCYPRKLYDYGRRCIDLYSKHPNVLMGIIGNEVMNSRETWSAAPCIHAYGRDLRKYMMMMMMGSMSSSSTTSSENTRETIIPLAYAAQHDQITAEIVPPIAMQLTRDMLTCRLVGDGDANSGSTTSSIDIFGINIESWCSSYNTFQYNEDNITINDYYALYEQFHYNTSHNIPIIFTEMGCSRDLFNHDNGMPPQRARDWKQVPVVLNQMSEVFSGFVAYGYDGPPAFRMMGSSNNGNKPWDGHTVLSTDSLDFQNFKKQLQLYNNENHGVEKTVEEAPTVTADDNQTLDTGGPPSCASIQQKLKDCCDIELYPINKMPSYFRKQHQKTKKDTSTLSSSLLLLVVIGITLLMVLLFYQFLQRMRQLYQQHQRLRQRGLLHHQQSGSRGEDDDDEGQVQEETAMIKTTYKSIGPGATVAR